MVGTSHGREGTPQTHLPASVVDGDNAAVVTATTGTASTFLCIGVAPAIEISCPVCKKRQRGDGGISRVYCTAKCPICLEEKSNLRALQCGHLLCPQDFELLLESSASDQRYDRVLNIATDRATESGIFRARHARTAPIALVGPSTRESRRDPRSSTAASTNAPHAPSSGDVEENNSRPSMRWSSRAVNDQNASEERTTEIENAHTSSSLWESTGAGRQDTYERNAVSTRDVELVMSQSGCSRERAAKALRDTGGDLVDSIMALRRGIEAMDVKLLMRQAGCSRATAIASLRAHGGDLVGSLRSLERGGESQDIELVMSQTGCSRTRAMEALCENGGDLIDSILSL